MVYVDDAHGEGVLGEGGRGIVSHFKLHGTRCTSRWARSRRRSESSEGTSRVREIWSTSRTTSRAPGSSAARIRRPVAAACIAAIDVLESEPQHVQRLWENTRHFKKAMIDLGFDTGKSETPITPVMVGDSGKAKKLSSAPVRGERLRAADQSSLWWRRTRRASGR